MEEKITLDRRVFRSLASDTKISILKSIDERRKTLSELSKELGMSVSTIKEHLDGLVKAGLIKQIDDGHKWKYYELTRTGNEILHPGSKKLMLILSAAILSMAGVFYDMIKPIGQPFGMGSELLRRSAPQMDNALSAASKVTDAAPGTAVQHAAESVMSAIQWMHIILLIIVAKIIGASFVYLILKV